MSAGSARLEQWLVPEAAAGAVTLGLSLAVHRLLPPSLQLPAGPAAGGLTVAIARGFRLSWVELGLSPRDAPRGVPAGFAAAAVLGAGTASGLLIPYARRFYLDDRIVEAGLRQLLHEVFLRTPLGTAVPEELVFQGALLRLLTRRRTRVAAAVVTSVLFGLWHVLPTLDRIESNPGTRHTKGDYLRTAAVVAATCTATTVADLGFAWLRLRSRSVLAPILAHIVPNAVGFLGGWAVSRLTSPPRV